VVADGVDAQVQLAGDLLGHKPGSEVVDDFAEPGRQGFQLRVRRSESAGVVEPAELFEQELGNRDLLASEAFFAGSKAMNGDAGEGMSGVVGREEGQQMIDVVGVDASLAEDGEEARLFQRVGPDVREGEGRSARAVVFDEGRERRISARPRPPLAMIVMSSITASRPGWEKVMEVICAIWPGLRSSSVAAKPQVEPTSRTSWSTSIWCMAGWSWRSSRRSEITRITARMSLLVSRFDFPMGPPGHRSSKQSCNCFGRSLLNSTAGCKPIAIP
jgi:hypothetical protein